MGEHLAISHHCAHAKERRKHGLAFLCIGLGLLLSVAASAQNPFRNLTTTAGGYSTWDSDLINIEGAGYTGRGVYVAVLDGGLVPNWRDYFPTARIATNLGIGFDQPIRFTPSSLAPCGTQIEVGALHTTTFVGGNGFSHGTHVTSTILGYFYRADADVAAGYVLPPIVVRGIAPDVTVVPVKVITDYQVPAMPQCGLPSFVTGFGTDAMIAAGIDYATNLKIAGYSPMIVTMSIGGFPGDPLSPAWKDAIDRAIANGVIVVAAAGNAGEVGMVYPGAYAPVISVGAVGWIGEYLPPPVPPQPATPPSTRYRMWWLQYPFAPLLPGTGDVRDPTNVADVYLTDFSSRAITSRGQQLDVLAPGSWVRGPLPLGSGYSHLPWWSKSLADFHTRRNDLTNFFFIGGTSMATPHVTSVAALMLQKNPLLTQSQVKSILRATALPLPFSGSQQVFEPSLLDYITQSWDTQCDVSGIGLGPFLACDPVGAGLIQADAAIASTP